MQCARARDAIQEFVDGTLGAIRQAELRQHLDQCDACRALADDLQRIRDTADSLDQLTPPDHIWLQIAGRLRQSGVVRDRPASVRAGTRHVAILAIAASLIVAVGAALMLLSGIRRTEPATSGTTAENAASNAGGPSVLSAEADLQEADALYQRGITKLEEAAKGYRESLDPVTAATLEKNSQIIDQAIAESRAALKLEPHSPVAQASLFDALKRKVALLQDTIALMNEMRKGNAAGAAQVVEGINKS
jgi:hypothetical protein